MPSPIVTTFLVLTVVLVLLPSEVAAFGAGDIPDFSYLEGKAFRHGDIENTLLELVKAVGHSQGGGLLGFAQNMLSAATGGAKFSKEDVKHVYFGNWLRDYSQAMDIAGLSKLSGETITLIVSVLAFLEFGFATDEYEVTQDRLGVYLPVEHIDNPRGYAEKEGDARTYNQKLRPPVNPRELEIDSRTGMKNYMATEDGGWDTSTAFIRRSLRGCIQKGRSAGGRDGAELWEAYRLLGQGLHTLEDFTAHSNWVELALHKLGHKEVFCHVGDNVSVNSPNGRVPPIVTGTFGGADFFHSLLGETTDKISQSSVTDLSAKMSESNNTSLDGLKNILGKLKGLTGNDSDSQLNHAEEMKRKSEAYHFDPNRTLPPEVVNQLKEVLKFHDDVMRSIIKKMEMVPGLTDLIDGLSTALNAFVYTVIAPYVTPVLTQVTSAVGEGSKAVISAADQWEVFNDPNASDPTHSVLSKDHFGIILNEPAGKVAKVVVEHSVKLIVEAWSNNSNPDDVINKIIEAFHHPHYNNGRSEIRNKMLQVVEQWLGDLGHSKAQETIQCLTKGAVREGKNKRGESSDGHGSGAGYSGGYTSGNQTGGSYGGGSTQQSYSSGGSQKPKSGYGGGSGGNEYGGGSYGRSEDNSYGKKQSSYSRSDNESYGNTQSGYGRSDNSYGNKQSTCGRSDNKSYENTQSGYGRSDSSYGDKQSTYGRSDNKSYENTQSDYGRSGDTSRSSQGNYGRSDDNSYGRSETTYESGTTRRGGSGDNSYGGNQRSYGRSDGNNSGSYGRQEERSSGYGGSGGGYGSKQNDDDNSHDTSHRSGYQPSYQPSYQPPENTYSSRNTYSGDTPNNKTYSPGITSSHDTYSSRGGYGGQTEGRYNTSSGYGGSDPYGSNEPSGFGGGGNRGEGRDDGRSHKHHDEDHGEEHRHHKHHDEGHGEESRRRKHHDDDNETYGAERLNLRDDDDDRRRRPQVPAKNVYGGNEGYGSRYSGGGGGY